ncbi:hypothetical protein [Neptunomonas sp.]|uniref:hypothetical protein n=1 Tax=Neptunomonas sp. TaxID=1971898 RepID=UPI0025E6F9EC|nr:hypothetical protein [Neptunomonas sp.]
MNIFLRSGTKLKSLYMTLSSCWHLTLASFGAGLVLALSLLFINPALAENLYPQLKSPSAQAIGGNWKLVVLDQENKAIHQNHIVMWPPVKHICEKNAEDLCYYHLIDDPEKKWESSYITYDYGYFDRGLEVSGNTLKFSHAYGITGHWGSDSQIEFSSGQGLGTWVYSGRGGLSGKESWTRLFPEITHIDFGRAAPIYDVDMNASPENRVEFGKRGHVSVDYDEKYWDPEQSWFPNRPKFFIRVFGENLWGFHAADIKNEIGLNVYGCHKITDENSTKFMSVIGWGCTVEVRPGSTSGRKIFRLDNLEIPFDLNIKGKPDSRPKIQFVDTSGELIHGVMEGQVFSVQAEFNEGGTVKGAYTASAIQNDKTVSIPMRVTDNPRVFTSGLYRVMQPHLVENVWSDWRAMGEDIEIPAHVAQVLSDHFSGTWQVHQSDEYGRSALTGVATVSKDGHRVELSFGADDKQRHFEMYDANVGLTPDGNAPAHWTGFFAEYATTPEHTLDPRVTNLWFPKSDADLSFTLKETDEVLGVYYLNKAREPSLIEVSFSQPLNKEWLAGDWLSNEGVTPVGKGGATIWTRKAPQIDKVIVLRNQRPGAFGSEYPKDFLKEGAPQRYRRLLIIGENLPPDGNIKDHSGTLPESSDPLIEYTRVYIEEDNYEFVLKKAFDDRNMKRLPAGKEYMVVNAYFDFGIAAGQKTLSLAQAKGRWDLRFTDASADLRFTRSFSSGSKASLDVLHRNDAAYLAIEFEHDKHLKNKKEIELAIFAGKDKPSLMGKVVARRVIDELKPEFRTDLIYFDYDYLEKYDSQMYQGEGLHIPVELGLVLYALPVDSGIAVDVVKVTIDESDLYVGEYWKSALSFVKAAGGKGDLEKPIEFAMKPAEGYNKNLYMAGVLDDRNRRIDLRNGDHAAAILIRDEFVRRMAGLLPKYAAQANSPAEVQRVIKKARSNISSAKHDPFWKYTTKNSLYFPGGIPLWELLDTDDVMKRFGWGNRSETEVWVFDAIEKAMKQRVKDMRSAKERAEKAPAYKIEELMMFAGYRSPEIIDSITARLVVKKEGRWVPDKQAIRFVEGLYSAGAAMRALDAYSEIDNIYNMLALAVITGGTAGALELGGLSTAAAYTSFIMNTADMVLSGGFGLHQYMKGEMDYETASGITPIYGDEVMREAVANRQSGFMTAIGILFPGQAAVREALGIPGLKQIASGKGIAGKVNGDKTKLMGLEEADKMDVLAYYKSLRDRRLKLATGSSVHPKLTPEDYKNYRELRKALNPNLKKLPWEMTQAERGAQQALRVDEALDAALEERRVTALNEALLETVIEPASSSARSVEVAKTEALPPIRKNTPAIEDSNKTKIIPHDPSKTVGIPDDSYKTLPIPDDPHKTVGISNERPMDQPTPGFGMSPVDHNAPHIKVKPEPIVDLGLNVELAGGKIDTPFQGRLDMDAYQEARARYSRQKTMERLGDEIEEFELENRLQKGSKAYEEGLDKIRLDWKIKADSGEVTYAREMAELEKDHVVMEVVEKHTGYRMRSDYTQLDIERIRPGRKLSKEQGVVGVLLKRFMRKEGQLTAKQHLSAIKEIGLSRSEAKAYIVDWLNPNGAWKDTSSMSKFADRYLDWSGLK